jgi:pilus assembly protein CpaB
MRGAREAWIIAVVFGLLAGLTTFIALQRKPEAEAAETQAPAMVVVAERDLMPGTVLQAADVKAVEWPAAAVPPGSSSDPGSLIGRGVTTRMNQYEPVLTAKLSATGAGGGLSALIPDGMRAVSIAVSEVSGVSGFIVPGSHVDIIAARQNDAGVASASTILTDVRVLASGQTMQPDPATPALVVPVVTLLVEPDEAELLASSAQNARLVLSLRNDIDQTAPVAALAAAPPAATAQRTASAPARPATAPPALLAAPAPRTSAVIEILQGAARRSVTVREATP